jgi:hypothetical protein
VSAKSIAKYVMSTCGAKYSCMEEGKDESIDG